MWSQVHDEGAQILENLANIRVPVIAAVEGQANVHSEYALMANVIVAGEGATFHDLPNLAEESSLGMACSRRGATAQVRGARKHSYWIRIR